MGVCAGDAGVGLVTECFDACGDLASAVGVLDAVEVQASGSELVEVDREVDRQERVYERGAPAGASGDLDIAKVAAGGGGDLAVDDAGPLGGVGVGVGDGVAVQDRFVAGPGMDSAPR